MERRRHRRVGDDTQRDERRLHAPETAGMPPSRGHFEEPHGRINQMLRGACGVQVASFGLFPSVHTGAGHDVGDSWNASVEAGDQGDLGHGLRPEEDAQWNSGLRNGGCEFPCPWEITLAVLYPGHGSLPGKLDDGRDFHACLDR